MTATPAPTVLLRHDLPDGSWHVDWMLAQDADGVLPLVTFRLPVRLDELAVGASLAAEAIGDHRPAYLAYEGPIAGNRGCVTRLAHGVIRTWDRTQAAWRLTLAWHHADADDRVQHVTITPETGAGRTIRCEIAGGIDATP